MQFITTGRAAALGVLILGVTVAAGAGELKVSYRNGLRLEGDTVSLKFGGRIMNDYAWIDGDGPFEAAFGMAESGTEFRRARLYMSGIIHDNIEFKAQYDFEDGIADFKDVYLGLKGLPGVSSLRLGHQKEPFSLEELTSSKYITFMERSLINVFAPARNTGARVTSTAMDGRLWWSGGAFTETGAFGERGDLDGGPNVTGRLAGLPILDEDGSHLLHVALGVTYKGVPDGMITFSSEPEIHLAPDMIDVTVMGTTAAHAYNAEVAWVRNRFSVQGEMTQMELDSPTSGDPTFGGYYIQGSVFLTGESRRYKQSSGAFDRIKPAENFDGQGGKGAWELALRHSMVDFNDGGIAAGELSSTTFGVNWYLNPSTRFMFNYVRAELSDAAAVTGEPGIDAAMLRFQIDF